MKTPKISQFYVFSFKEYLITTTGHFPQTTENEKKRGVKHSKRSCFFQIIFLIPFAAILKFFRRFFNSIFETFDFLLIIYSCPFSAFFKFFEKCTWPFLGKLYLGKTKFWIFIHSSSRCIGSLKKYHLMCLHGKNWLCPLIRIRDVIKHMEYN